MSSDPNQSEAPSDKPGWPGGKLYFLAPFSGSSKAFRFELAGSDERADDNPEFLFSLPEYEQAFGNVLEQAVEELTLAKSPVLRTVVANERAEHVRRTHATAPSGEVVTKDPMTVAMRYVFTVQDVVEFDLEAFARQCDTAAEQLTDEKLDLLLEYSGRICEAYGNVRSAGGRPFGWEVLLEWLEEAEIAFAPDGQPVLPTMVAEYDKRNIVPYPPKSETVQRAFDKMIARKRKQADAGRRSR